MWGSGGTDSLSEGSEEGLKHTSSALIQCDYDLNHCQPGKQEAQRHRLTVRGVISLVSEKLLTHIITPSPLKKRSPICSHTQTIMPMFRETEGRLREDRQSGIIKKS